LSLFRKLLIQILLNLIPGLFPLLLHRLLNLLPLRLSLFARLIRLIFNIIRARRVLILLLPTIGGTVDIVQFVLTWTLAFGGLGSLVRGVGGKVCGFGGGVGEHVAEEDVCVGEEFAEFGVGVD